MTVLFADVVGFTPLSEVRDPEHVKNLLDRCFERLAADVTSHGGRVDKIVGDEVMAIFGAPVAHEDDPERAVRAAMQMQRTLAEHAEETSADVRMRIGVNTGEVLVGALRGGGDVTALGDVVNIAKRLQTAAEPGAVLVGPDTYATTSQIISYEKLGKLAMKGREAPVAAWRAIAALGPPGARPGRARTPLVGRKSEIALVWHALGTAVSHNRPHFLLLVGDAGMGKTALVEEAIELAKVQHDALVLEGRCLPYGEANPWWPVAETLRQACEIDPEDPADVAADKCRRSIGAVMGTAGEGTEASRVADGLLYLMGYEGKLNDLDPSRAKDEAVRSIQVALAANARQRPLVVVLSEIHWADQLILDFVDAMFDRLRNLPIILIATARPDLEERWTPKAGRHNLFVVNLDPLDRAEVSDLARSLLGSEPSADFIDLLCERSGGNPLFINELISMMGDSSIIPGGHRDEGAELPATLRGLVSARLDALDRADRAVVEDASVVGRSGSIAALAALGASRGETESKVRLATLAHKDFFILDGTEYEFRSDLVRDVAYETLTKGERAKRHAAIAEWLESYAKRTEREEEHLERIAHHFVQAATLARDVGAVDGVPTDIFERALDWVERAATRAEERETTGTSVHLYEHALELVRDDPEMRARFLLGRARGRGGMRHMEGAHSDIAEVLQIAEGNGSAELRAKGLTIRGEIEQKAGDLDRSAATLEEAVSVWQDTGDRAGEAEALRLWGFTSIHRGALDAAEHAIAQALDISRVLKDRRGEAWALQNLAWAAFSRGDFDRAEERLLASSNLFEEIGDLGGRSWALGLLGYVWYFKGQLDRAASVAAPSVEFAREMGDRWAYGMMINLLASVRLWQGRTNEALERANDAFRLFTEIDDNMGLSFAAVVRVWALVFTGRGEEAIEVADNVATASPAAFGAGVGAIMGAANVRNLIGRPEDALGVLDAAGIDANVDDEDLLSGRALILLVGGHVEEAYACASRAWAMNPTDIGTRANTACTLSLIAAAAGHPEEAITLGEEVTKVGGSYLDQARAHIGRAFGYAQLGDDAGVHRALEAARKSVENTEDVLNRALVGLAQCAIAMAVRADLAPQASAINEARDRLETLGVTWRPWERAFRLAATGGRGESVTSGPVVVGPVA